MLNSNANFDLFAEFYDDDYRAYNSDLPTLIQLAAECDGTILELGCGTGRVLIPMASAGFSIHGVDISTELLRIAHAKVHNAGLTKSVTLHKGDMSSIALPACDYGFVFCVSNTFMHCTTITSQYQVLTNAFRHMRSKGMLLIDLFNPDIPSLAEIAGLCELADSWSNQTGDQVLKWSVRSFDIARQLQETIFIYEVIDKQGKSRRTICPFTLRFLWLSEGQLLLEKVGFELFDVWGDFDGSSYDSQSDRLIFLARKP